MVAIETMCVFFEVQLRLMKQLNVRHNSVEHNQVAEVLNEINAQFAVRIKK